MTLMEKSTLRDALDEWMFGVSNIRIGSLLEIYRCPVINIECVRWDVNR